MEKSLEENQSKKSLNENKVENSLRVAAISEKEVYIFEDLIWAKSFQSKRILYSLDDYLPIIRFFNKEA